MRRVSYSLLWTTALASVVLATPGTALAAGGTTTSAGDQQYLDPLTSTTTSAPPPSPPPASAPTTSPATTSAVSAPRDPGRHTLPYTGFNLWTLVWVGFGLIALGVVLRRLSRRRSRPDAP